VLLAMYAVEPSNARKYVVSAAMTGL